MGDLSQTKLSFWNDAALSFRNDGLAFFSKWWWLSLRKDDGFLFEMMDWLSPRDDWWFSLRKIDSFLFDMKMMPLREMGLDALCCFRNDSHLSCHRRKMLCPVVFTFERIVYFEERPYIFGNDSWFRNESSRQKLSKSYHLVKIGNLVKIFALTS